MEALLKVMQNIICVLDCVFFCGQCLFSLCNSKTLKGDESDILESSGRQFAEYPGPALRVECVEWRG